MSFGTQVASLFGVLTLDDKDFQRGLSDAEKGMKSAGEKLENFGKGLANMGGNLTLLGAPFLGLAAVGQNAFDEMDDAADQLGAVIKSTGGAAGVTRQEALLLGAQLQDLTGITRATIVGGENILLTFTNIGGQVFPRVTKAALDLSVAMKQDMKSSAVQLGKALNDPVEGITALTRVGVTFTQSQKDMIKAMVEAGNIAGAQGVILTEIEKEFGGSAAAAADPIDHLRTTINDLAIDLGVALQPVLETVIPIIQDLAKKFSVWLTTMTDNGDNTVGIIIAIGAGLAILGPILAAIGAGITAIGGLLAVIFSPIGLIIGAIVGLFVAFQNNFLGIRDFLQPVIDQIVDFFNHFQERIQLYGSLLKLYFEYYIGNPLSNLWNAVQPALQSLLNWFVSDGIPWIQQALLDIYNNVIQPVFKFLGDVWNFVKDGLTNLWNWFVAPGGGLDTIKKALDDVNKLFIQPFINVLKDIWKNVQPALEEFKKGIQTVFDWVKTNVINPIIERIEWFLKKLDELRGVNPDAKMAAGLPSNMVQPTVKGVTPGDPLAGISGMFYGPNRNDILNAINASHRAIGGSVYAGGSYIVGEQGPELFTPSTSGNISTAQQTAGMMGGMHIGAVNVYANSYEQGAAAAAGFMDKARSMGYSFG